MKDWKDDYTESEDFDESGNLWIIFAVVIFMVLVASMIF